MLDRPSTSSRTARSATCSQTSSRPPSTVAYEKPTDDEVHQKPWKYIGYKGYSDFISSEDNFFLLRRFDELNVRVALAMQDEIAQLEEELQDVDKGTMAANAPDFNNGTLRGDIEGRSTLIKAISEKLRHYNELILQQSALRRYSKAPKRDRKNVQNWHFNHDYAAIAHEEQAYLEKEDLVSVAYTEKTPLRKAIDSSLRLRTLPVWRHRENTAPSYDAREVTYYSDKRMNAFASAVIIAIGVVMLLTPIWILQAMGDLKGKLAVITVFIFIFLLVLSLAMVAKPFEALGATAAYAAVLMVFIQLGS
ncbi:hypothetical protein CGCFRS4_v008921 [Colletotrichum fructicola]|nr:hypothetical protein CFRS1_v012550 [Colletotrichum fructicola]KAF4890241.1 hypothetical protein CGCFRS4_v008921 [Colletotrichum fructicola]